VTEPDRTKYLQLALRAIAVVFIAGLYPLTIVWPSGWAWHPGQSEYLQMILGLYATLGVFLWLAARDPGRHLGLIAFTIWSSIVHGGIMAVQAMDMPAEHGHLLGDIPALLLVAVVLAVLMPRGASAELVRSAA